MRLQIMHEIWEKLENLYEGDKHVKVAKLQSLKGKYKMLRMGEDENISSFMDKVNDLVLNIRCASGIIEEDEIVAKVMRYLPLAYKHKVAAIDEIQRVTIVTRDMLVGKLAAFELSELGESHGKTKTTFKDTVSGKKKYDPRESSTRVSRYEREMREMKEQKRELEELKALLARIQPKGAGKYEGKLPLKCFSCNKIAHFASRYPERPKKVSKYDKPYKPNHNYRYQKKCYYAADEGVIDDESEKGNSKDEFVFIAIKEDDLILVDSTSCIVEEKALATKIEKKDE